MKYFFRILSLPYILGFWTTKFISVIIKGSYLYIRYGGEMNVYDHPATTIRDVYDLVSEKL